MPCMEETRNSIHNFHGKPSCKIISYIKEDKMITLRYMLWDWELDGIGSSLCPMVGFGIHFFNFGFHSHNCSIILH